MVQNAQSDNEKASLMYQVELFKDKIEDMDEAYALLQVITNSIYFMELLIFHSSLFIVYCYAYTERKQR